MPDKLTERKNQPGQVTERKFIYDAYGNKVYLSDTPITDEVAAVRLQDVYSSYPSSGLTAARLASILKLADAGDIYHQMELFEEIEEKDTRIFASLQTRKQAVIGLKWDILPADKNDKEAVRQAEFVKEVLLDISNFVEAQLNLLDAIAKGYSIVEIIWDIREGKNIVVDLKWRHQKRFTWNDEQTELRLLTDTEPSKGESLAEYPAKFIVHKYKARSGYPAKDGLLRTLACFHMFKSYNTKDWVRFCELYGIPLRLGHYDSNASPADRTALRTAVQALGSDGAGIISRSTEITFESGIEGSASSDVFKTFIDFINTEITIVILGQTATTEGTPGKLGAEMARDKVRQDLLEADCISLDKAITSQLIIPLVIFNFGPQIKYPKYKTAYEPPEDLNKRIELDKILAKEIRLPMANNYFYETYNRPVPEKDEELVNPSVGGLGSNGPMIPMKASGAQETVVMGQGRFSPQQQGVEDIGDTVLHEYEKIYPNIEKKLTRIVMSSDSLKQIRDRMYLAFDELSSDDMEQLIARAMITAQMYGAGATGRSPVPGKSK